MSRVGREVFRSQFADWAGHNCANMDYLTREQVNGNIGEDDIDGWDNKGSKKTPKLEIVSVSVILAFN